MNEVSHVNGLREGYFTDLSGTSSMPSSWSWVYDFFASIGRLWGSEGSAEVKNSYINISETEAWKSLKSSTLYECTGRKPNQNGGYIYEMTLRKGYVQQMNSPEYTLFSLNMQDFPALERNPKQLGSLNILPWRFLGFKKNESNTELYLPDADALMANWRSLKVHYPKLPDLKICNSDGVAPDSEFVKKLEENDLLISTGREFIHDMTVHVMPYLSAVFYDVTIEGEPLFYQSFKNRKVELINRLRGIYIKASEAAKRKNCHWPSDYETAWYRYMGIICDTISADFGNDDTEQIFNNISEDLDTSRNPLVSGVVWETWEGYWYHPTIESFDKFFRIIHEIFNHCP